MKVKQIKVQSISEHERDNEYSRTSQGTSHWATDEFPVVCPFYLVHPPDSEFVSMTTRTTWSSIRTDQGDHVRKV